MGLQPHDIQSLLDQQAAISNEIYKSKLPCVEQKALESMGSEIPR